MLLQGDDGSRVPSSAKKVVDPRAIGIFEYPVSMSGAAIAAHAMHFATSCGKVASVHAKASQFGQKGLYVIVNFETAAAATAALRRGILPSGECSCLKVLPWHGALKQGEIDRLTASSVPLVNP